MAEYTCEETKWNDIWNGMWNYEWQLEWVRLDAIRKLWCSKWNKWQIMKKQKTKPKTHRNKKHETREEEQIYIAGKKKVKTYGIYIS